MDCCQAWNLMMKSFDRENSQEAEGQLKAHLDLCEGCRTQYEVLADAFSEMHELNDVAPQDMEMRVMQKLGEMKKEEKILLPFVAVPLLMLLFIIAYGLYQAVSMGPIALIDQIAKGLTAAYRTSQAVFIVIHWLFRTYYIMQAILVLLISGVVYGIFSLVMNYRKARNQFIWRISK